MKILRLRLHNLNSLRGESTIDFTRAPLAHAGLFAITGATGAGKSTLLDAITLALYGRAARYGSTPNPEAVMSRHTGECSAAVEFSCAAGEFRSTWQLGRARKKADGKVQPAKRLVIALPGEAIIAETIKEADAKILELTGLDYDRFLRSVLLAQGDFATFLKAGARERTDLLQQVTGTFVYQDISRAAFRRATEAEQALALLRREQEGVSLLSPDLRARDEAARDAHTERLGQLQALVPILIRRIGDARRWLELENLARQLAADEALQHQARREAVTDLARLARHEQAAPFIADLTTLSLFAREDEKDTAARRGLEDLAPGLLDAVRSAETAAQQAAAQLQTENERIQGLRTLWNEVNGLDTGLAAARAELRQVTQQHTAAEARVTAETSACAAARVEWEKTVAGHRAELAWLEQHHVDAPLGALLPEIQTARIRWQVAVDAATAAAAKLGRQDEEQARVQTTVSGLESALAPLRQAVAIARADVTAARTALAAAAENVDGVGWEARRDQARDRRLTLEALAAEAGRIRTAGSELTTLAAEAERAAASRQRAADDTARLTHERNNAFALLEAHRATLAFAEKVQSLESHRASLRDEAPCPLCGARHHPYAHTSDTPAEAVTAARERAAAAEAAWRDAEARQRTAESTRAALEADARRLAGDAAKRTDELARLTVAWNRAAGPHGLEGQADHETRLASAIAAAREDERRTEAGLTAWRLAETKLTQALATAQAAEVECGGHETAHKTQCGMLDLLRTQRPGIESELAEHRRKAEAEGDAWRELTKPFLAPTAGAPAAEAVLEELTRRADVFRRHGKAAEELHALAATRQATLDGCTRQLTAAGESRVTAAAKLADLTRDVEQREEQRRSRFGSANVAEAQRAAEAAIQTLRGAADETRGTLEACRRRQETAAKEVVRLTAAITARADQRIPVLERVRTAGTAAGFADDTAIRAALLGADEAAKLAGRRTALDDRATVLKTRADGLAVQRGQLPPAAAEDAGKLAALELEKDTHEAALTATLTALAEVRARLKQDDELRERHAAGAERIVAAEREFARWEQLRRLIGSADGSLFARFAQGLTLEHLTILANHHLRELNPRYSIRRATDGETGDLELEIVDHYQADTARPMRSLSGGESFLVSLALALGLSRLASGRTSIESLFIDEGFGSLDADTLEVAMAALESLQAGGKIIGVISHVPAMQERISVRIAVTKEAGGCSRLELQS